MRRTYLVPFVLALLAQPAAARAGEGWQQRIDRIIGGRSVSVMVSDDGAALYRHLAARRRIPASNEKLLLSMALLDRLDADTTIETTAAMSATGDLWILGRGDPAVTGGGRYARSLPFDPTRLGALARRIRDAGITTVARVVGSTGYFAHDWNAPGWKPQFNDDEVPLPSALTFDGNVHRDEHVADPELRAARSLTKKLRALGVAVGGEPAAGAPPGDLTDVASLSSQPLEVLMRYMNRRSSNFFAELLGKRLAVERYGAPGTIANGARAIEAWAARRGVTIDAYDSSGLSYANRASAAGIAALLEVAEAETWGVTLRSTLPAPGQGTLEDRLNGVRVRAKTGTLEEVSALSGWVWLRRTQSWAAFSILSRGMEKSTAASIENQIVRELTRSAN